ncbi:MAG TPA: TetR/AcrR family transcriptional regulator [Myxococcota bacterium]|nr:TetR/AcrR family transcriptional regulator [Myxococcota bacterium]
MPARLAPRRPSAGHLADRLIEAAEAILVAEGLEALTLRAIARRAGVTHGAPLRHYPSFAALLSEVAARGFRALFAAVEAAEAELPAGAGPRARLAAAARAYVRCAVARPGVFALMFRPELLDVAAPGFARDSQAAFDQLVRAVRAAQDGGWRTDAPTRRLAGALWSSVHGLASLWSQGAYQGVVRATSLDEALDTHVELILSDPQPRSPR